MNTNIETETASTESLLKSTIASLQYRWWTYRHTYDLDSRWDTFQWEIKIFKSSIRGRIIIVLDWCARLLLTFACWLVRRWSRRMWWEYTNYGKQTPMLDWHGKLVRVGTECEHCDIDVSKYNSQLSKVMSDHNCTYPQAVERMVEIGLSSGTEQQ